MTLTIYQQLIQDLKPKTIIEFGTYEGGSALWMNDICKSLLLNTKDTIDIIKYSEMIQLDLSKYKINRKYCDFWGQNNTWNCDSFLEKVCD